MVVSTLHHFGLPQKIGWAAFFSIAVLWIIYMQLEVTFCDPHSVVCVVCAVQYSAQQRSMYSTVWCSKVKCSTYSAVCPVQTGQELFFQLRFSMLLLLLFSLQTPLIPFLAVQHIRIYRQWTLQSYLLWYSLYSRYPWPLPCKILSSVESTGPRSLCSRGLPSRYVLTINYVLKLCV